MAALFKTPKIPAIKIPDAPVPVQTGADNFDLFARSNAMDRIQQLRKRRGRSSLRTDLAPTGAGVSIPT